MFNSIVNVIDNTELNAIVIDVKGNDGKLSYRSTVPLAIRYGTGVAKIPDIRQVMDELREKRIFPIARIVAFRDPLIAARKPEWAVRNRSGAVWTDDRGVAWVDPYNREYWDYLVDVAREAVILGFREIQFDYVRFTSDGKISECVYPFRSALSHEDLIPEFLRYVRQRLADLHVPMSADVFGLTTTAEDDLGIGQNFSKLAPAVDIVCPMVYPSHYATGFIGLSEPDKYPYRVVFRGVSDGVRRLSRMRSTTIMRPWLQAFSLGNHYGREQIQAQVQAAKDAGATEWLFWDAGCTYRISDFR